MTTQTFPQSLTLVPSTPFAKVIGSALQQIDEKLLIIVTSNPQGVQAANKSGIFCWDEINQNMYIATVADGTTAGTTWQQLIFSFTEAAIGTLGLIMLAASADVQDGTDSQKAVTSNFLAEFYAHNGINSDITKLLGLTTPLSVSQGGTGLAVAGTAGNVIVSTGSALVSVPFYGAGASGGNIAGPTQVLTYASPTKWTYTNSPLITLPAVDTTKEGMKFTFKGINTPGTGAATWQVAGGGNVEGNSTYSDLPYTTEGYPVTTISIFNGAWWIGV